MLGVVREVLDRPANDVLVVTVEGGDDLLVPFTRDAVPEVDVPGPQALDPPRPALMLELDVFTLFPHWFAWLSEERAVQNSLGTSASLRLLSLRDFSPLKHAQVDDAPVRGRRGHAAPGRRDGRRARGRLRHVRSTSCEPSAASSPSIPADARSTTPTPASSRPRRA